MAVNFDYVLRDTVYTSFTDISRAIKNYLNRAIYF